jgi:hypothetical protein
MLDTTLATTFVPGTNLKGEVAGANWFFLLPSLELEQILCLGTPPLTTLTALARLSHNVVVMCTISGHLQQISELSQRRGLDNVYPVAPNGQAALSLPSSRVDLALIVGKSGIRCLSRDRALLAELQRLLKPEGLIYFEFGGPIGRLLEGKGMDNGSEWFGPPQLFWVTPSSGETHTAVPLEDRDTIKYFLRHKLYSPSVNLRAPFRQARRYLSRHRRSSQPTRRSGALAGRAVADSANHQPRQTLRPIAQKAGVGLLRSFEHVEEFLGRHLLFSRLTWRYGALVGCAPAGLADQPPQYLRTIARDAGIDIENYRWGLSAPGDYSSRKVLFFLFGPSTSSPVPGQCGTGQAGHRRARGSPEYIVKMIRDPIFNPRLENEYRALSLLHEKGIGDRETLPQVVFFGHHSDLAIVGETAIDGTPFRQQTEATADCPYARAAIDWLIDLSAATANPTAATPEQVAEGLRKLFNRFVEIYRLTPEQHAFLAEQIATIARSQEALPLVFQHGDPGTWNVMVTKSGRVAFLDWEAAESQGMPLWDLFYFTRSYCVGAARARGTRDRLEGFSQQFLAESPLSRLVVEATGRYCERTGLPGHLVEPLFYTCWMHRALKEANRLTPASLEGGHYVNLLRLCIEQRNAPTLRRLFSLPGPN